MRAQLTVEFLLMFAILLVIVVAFIQISQTSETGVRQTKIKGEALSTLQDLSAAAKEVYAQGAGAKKQVYINIPEGYEPSESFIGNRSIRLRVAGNDYMETETFDVHGTLPASPGGHWIWVISEGNMVRIGYAMIELDKAAIVVNMEPEITKTVVLKVRNIWPSVINVSLSRQWTDVGPGIDPDTDQLVSGETARINLEFKADENTVGFFAGELRIEADDGKVEEHVRIPFTVVVHSSVEGDIPPLYVVPSMLNASMERNSSVVRSFQVCTNPGTELDYVNVSASSGEPGSWVSGTEPLGAMQADQCIERLLNISTPEDIDLGVYEGFVEFFGRNASDTVALMIDIGGVPYDSAGPSVLQIYNEGRFPMQAGAVYVKAADAKSMIKKCEVRADSGAWKLMHAVDGTFDELKEDADYTFSEGFALGNHTVYARCTDAKGNVGPVKSMRFRVIKELLFVKLDEEMTQYEKEWLDWISLYHSGEGLGWSHDVVAADQLSAVDMSDYAVIVMAEYEEDPLLAALINAHLESGGSLLLLGAANERGMFEFCQSNEFGIPRPGKEVEIFVRDHYITSPYSGMLQIFTIDSKMYMVREDYIGIPLAVDGRLNVLGEIDGVVSWGPERPFRFNQNGIDLTRRVVDYAILSSSKK